MTVRGDLFDSFDPRAQRGTFDFGANATGVIQSKLHFTGDEIISEDVMPAWGVQQIMDSVAELRNRMSTRKQGGVIGGQVPTPLYMMWYRQWQKEGRQHGLLWRAFLTSKLMDGEYSKLRTMNL